VIPRSSALFYATPLLRLTLAAHAAGGAALLWSPASWPAVAAALLANHLLIGAAAISPRSRLLGPNLSRIPGTEGSLALTFDDGPDPEVTPRILDVLDRFAARATFFFVGRRVAAHPALAAEVRARGHGIGNHSHTHPDLFAFYGPSAVWNELQNAQDAVEAATGRRPSLFRAPVGFRGPWLQPCLARAGLRLVSWTRRGYDTVTRQEDVVLQRLTKGLRAGDILLLHDGSSALDAAGRPVVLDVLPRLLERIAQAGLRAVAVPES
jgi:peptidoglycan/xylan/chitin deacetylase (PgdA/CDA1 family)